jgi:hypothetical protein
MIKDDLFQLFIDLLLFSQDHITFSLDCSGLKLRVLQDIADDVNCGGHILAEALGIIDRLFARRIRIQVRADILNLEFESMLASPASPLKRHVFQKVSRSICRIRLCSRACVYPHTDCSCLGMWLRLCCDRQTV